MSLRAKGRLDAVYSSTPDIRTRKQYMNSYFGLELSNHYLTKAVILGFIYPEFLIDAPSYIYWL